MFYRLFLFGVLAYFSTEAAADDFRNESETDFINKSCEVTGKITTNLDLALQLITNVRENYRPCPAVPLPLDCEDVLRRGHNTSGVYDIMPLSRAVPHPIEVYCDMVTDGGGWTVIQRRGDFLRPKDYFYQDWQAYKKGFGNLEEDFWLGNDNIFGISNQRHYSVRFDLEDVANNSVYALYDTFWIDDENNKYTLHIGGYSGNAGDSMARLHNGQKFSTKDQRNDRYHGKSGCAQEYKGGWWYNNCHEANLNGLYHKGKHGSYADGINWYHFRGEYESLLSTEIKIRRKNFRQ